MRFKITITVLILFLGMVFALWDQLGTPSQITEDQKLSPLLLPAPLTPNPSFTSLEGTVHKLHDFQGRVIVLNFWATWCPPCVVEFPQLLELAALKKDRLVLIAMSVDKDPDNIKNFLEKLDPAIRSKIDMDNIIIARDPDKAISQDLFQTVLYPETFIIGPNLVIVKKIVGLTDWTGEDILKLVDVLM